MGDDVLLWMALVRRLAEPISDAWWWEVEDLGRSGISPRSPRSAG
jgi:hypothetical protein